MHTRRGIRVRVVAALAALAMLALPAAAHAQGALLDGTPLNVFADGLGGIQVRVDGLAAGLFYDPDANPAHAGLEIKEGDTVYPLEQGFETAPGRSTIEPPTVIDRGGGTRLLHTSYSVGTHLRVTEDHTYTDQTTQVTVHYGIQNISSAPVSIRAGVLADLYVGANDTGTGVIAPAAPRFVGGRDDASGLVYGLQEITPWSALQEGDFELVFTSFAGNGLASTVDSNASDNGVGVSWQLDDIAPGETRGIDVRWLLAAPAPPGTVAPSAPTGGFVPDADGVIHAQGGVLPPPVVGKRVNVRLLRGRVCYTPPKAKRCVRLTEPVQLPVGTAVDTTRGRVTLISAASNGGTVQSAWFYDGIFRIGQASDYTTELTLTGPQLSCPRARRASAAAKKVKTRRLWGDGKGKFRTRGRFSSATVRGTKWVIIDRCDGTLVRVTQGSVLVRDTRRKRNIIVRAGKSYLARK